MHGGAENCIVNFLNVFYDALLCRVVSIEGRLVNNELEEKMLQPNKDTR